MIWQFIDSSGVGGAERHIETLARGLRGRGLEVAVVLLQDHGRNPWGEQMARAGLTARHLDGRWRTLVNALRQDRPALLHTHGYKAGIFGRTAARLAGVPVVSTFHSGARGPMPVGIYEAIDDWTSFLGQRIAVSSAIQQRLPFHARVIPSYVLSAQTPPTDPLPSVVAFVGRLSPEKGPDIFCQMAVRAQATAGLQNLEWHVWGDGSMRASLARDFGHSVTFHGVATDMDAVWPQVGLLVMPSHFEGVPLAALEAAAHGIPVLASRVGGLPTVIDEARTGWLFPAGDVAAGLDGLSSWQAARLTGEAQSLRAACWAKAASDFSAARWLPEVLAVYHAAGLRAAPTAL